ncbi:MAG TPA: carboxypeptidase-like regulatory domain-containing protein, partial [Longimicrobium sp.]|nr:carboxypeptidase-like regulatory domain-containing protein [Longimicrobium sp.]
MGRFRLGGSAGRVAALLVCAAATARAQVPGAVEGRVTGPSGEPVPSALVRLSPVGGGDSRVTRTAADGRYRLAFPAAGARFSLWVERLGYAPANAVVDRG